MSAGEEFLKTAKVQIVGSRSTCQKSLASMLNRDGGSVKNLKGVQFKDHLIAARSEMKIEIIKKVLDFRKNRALDDGKSHEL